MLTVINIAGYSIVDLMELNPGTQIVFIVAMYISPYPVTISMRNSNVYQVTMNCIIFLVKREIPKTEKTIGTSPGDLW